MDDNTKLIIITFSLLELELLLIAIWLLFHVNYKSFIKNLLVQKKSQKSKDFDSQNCNYTKNIPNNRDMSPQIAKEITSYSKNTYDNNKNTDSEKNLHSVSHKNLHIGRLNLSIGWSERICNQKRT
jgi:hypothetical protein